MTTDSFEINSIRTGTGVRIAAKGELDILRAPSLRDHISQAGDADIVLDLADVTFIDSSGLHALLDAVAADHGRRIRIIASPVSLRLFDITGVRDQLPLVDLNARPPSSLTPPG